MIDSTAPPSKTVIWATWLARIVGLLGIMGVVIMIGFAKEPLYTTSLVLGMIVLTCAIWLRHRMPRRMLVIICIVAALAMTWKPLWIHVVSHGEATVQLIAQADERKGVRLVFTDQGTFQIEDVPLAFQFRSSDLYGLFRSNSEKRCSIEYFGIRWGLFSWYPTIIDATCQ